MYGERINAPSVTPLCASSAGSSVSTCVDSRLCQTSDYFNPHSLRSRKASPLLIYPSNQQMTSGRLRLLTTARRTLSRNSLIHTRVRLKSHRAGRLKKAHPVSTIGSLMNYRTGVWGQAMERDFFVWARSYTGSNEWLT